MITTISTSIPSPPPQPSHVVIVGGTGNVGKAFSTLLPTATVINRNQNLDQILHSSPTNTPILVCTTNDALSHVISTTPTSRRSDLIFLQNGMLLPELSRWKLQNNSTQVLLYLAAANNPKQKVFTDGKQTVCIGKWSPWFSEEVLLKNNLQCRIVSNYEEYKMLMVQKLLWACIFWMMSAALGGISVGEIVEKYQNEVEELVEELVAVANAALFSTSSSSTSSDSNTSSDVLLDPKVALEAVIAYSMRIPAAVPSKEMALKEFQWRNGWFLAQRQSSVNVGSLERMSRWEEQTKHVEWLSRAGAGEYIV